MKFNAGKVCVIRDFDLDEIKTKKALEILKRFEAENALMISHQDMVKFEVSSRNIPHFRIIRPAGLNVYDILSYDKLLILESSASVIEGGVKGEVSHD